MTSQAGLEVLDCVEVSLGESVWTCYGVGFGTIQTLNEIPRPNTNTSGFTHCLNKMTRN